MSRTRLIVIAAVVFLVLVAAGAVGRAYFAEPGARTDYIGRMNDYLAEHEPEGDAAWPVYRRMIVETFGCERMADVDFTPLYERIEEHVSGYEIEYTIMSGRWDDPRHDARRALVDDADPVFEALAEAATKPRLGKPYIREGDVMEGEQAPEKVVAAHAVLLPEMQFMNDAARLTLAAIRDAGHEQRWDAFASRVEAGVALGEHLMRVSLPTEVLAGARMISEVATEIRHRLNESEAPAGVCSELNDIMLIDTREPLRHSIRLNAMAVESLLDEHHDNAGLLVVWSHERDPSDLYEEANPSFMDRLGNVRSYAMPTFGESRDVLEAQTQMLVETVDAAPGKYEAAFDNGPFQSTGNGVVDKWNANYDRSLQRCRALERDLRATRLMLRLERVHAETGAWPESLDAPELAELAEDPVTGEPFAYQRTPDDPHGRPYVLTAPETSLAWIEGGEMNPPRPALPEGP